MFHGGLGAAKAALPAATPVIALTLLGAMLEPIYIFSNVEHFLCHVNKDFAGLCGDV